jgi:lysophospholipase L1-like esterase
MIGDPFQIPVQPTPFQYGLPNLAAGLQGAGPVKIVAVGSSTTAGEGGILAYPYRLQLLLRGQYPEIMIDVLNRGVGGQEAPAELARMDRDVIEEKPCLVIWQVGTNAVWQPPDQHPPSFKETIQAVDKGLKLLRQVGSMDVILMDLQYVPAVVTPAKVEAAERMVAAIGILAQQAGINVFCRFALMKGWHKVEGISFDRMTDPSDPDRLHDSDWATQRLTETLVAQIVSRVRGAQANAR